MPLPLTATVQTQQIREERWKETTRMMALQTRMSRLEISKNGPYEIQEIHRKQKYSNYEYKYPQVGKTGVDAVHESCPQMVYIMKKNCNL